MTPPMMQGEIWFADLNPVKGNEPAGGRPVVMISGNLLNTYLKVVICCPLTTKVKNFKGNVVLGPSRENGLKSVSEILTFHIRSISKDRLARRMGRISDTQLAQLKECLDDILRY